MKQEELFEEFLQENFKEKETIGYTINATECIKCGELLNGEIDYSLEDDICMELIYCENCNESWGVSYENIKEELYNYFVKKEEFFLTKNGGLYISRNLFDEWIKK